MSYNVFADMGLENPDLELLKSEIISSLRVLLIEKHLTPDTAAALWKMDPTAAAELLSGHWGEYSVERLFELADSIQVVDSVTHQPVVSATEKTLVLTP